MNRKKENRSRNMSHVYVEKKRLCHMSISKNIVAIILTLLVVSRRPDFACRIS